MCWCRQISQAQPTWLQAGQQAQRTAPASDNQSWLAEAGHDEAIADCGQAKHKKQKNKKPSLQTSSNFYTEKQKIHWKFLHRKRFIENICKLLHKNIITVMGSGVEVLVGKHRKIVVDSSIKGKIGCAENRACPIFCQIILWTTHWDNPKIPNASWPE